MGILLGVNIDHIATLRQARRLAYPDPIRGAQVALDAGADHITFHLREDRRHIQDADVHHLKAGITRPLNFELAATTAMIDLACDIRPWRATIVPERREELTTEGGLNAAGLAAGLPPVIRKLQRAGISVALFIDPDPRQIEASRELRVNAVEFHTGYYAHAATEAAISAELARLNQAARMANEWGLVVAAGHGLTADNLPRLVSNVSLITEYNIGHGIMARAVFVGLAEAVSEIKRILAPCVQEGRI